MTTKDVATDADIVEWEKGYDQAVVEIFDELRKQDPNVCSHILWKFAGWRKVWQREQARRKGQ